MGFLQFLLMMALFLLAIFLIVLVLIQRGKGGGLAGALGGMGGQSAFGTKAGDVFTRVTIGVAAVWIVLCIISVRVLSVSGDRLDLGPGSSSQQSSPSGSGFDPTGSSGSDASGGSGADSGPGGSPVAPGPSDASPQK